MRRSVRMLAASASLLWYSVSGLPASAMQILEATDHGELEAVISSIGVNRIALSGDRIARVIRSPGGYAAEHDPNTGDLYLRPSDLELGETAPVTLFIGTEKGFTYRLALTPAARGSAQILIRNAAAPPASAGRDAGGGHVRALVDLVRAVARREPPPGHAIEAAASDDALPVADMRIIETWRGPRFAAHVVEANRGAGDVADLAGTMGLPVAAVWLGPPGTGPAGGRLAVVVTARTGAVR